MSDMGKLFELATAIKSVMADQDLSAGEEVTMETMLVSLTIAENSPYDPEQFRRGLRRFCKALLKVRMERFDEDDVATVRFPGKERMQ